MKRNLLATSRQSQPCASPYLETQAKRNSEPQQPLRLSSGRDSNSVAAMSFARAGEIGAALRIAKDLARYFPEDTIVQYMESSPMTMTVRLSLGYLCNETMRSTSVTVSLTLVNKSSDDNTREIRQPKTKCSVALLPMPSALETTLRNYLRHWKPNAAGILFATKATVARQRGEVRPQTCVA